MLELISSRSGRMRYNITNPDEPYFAIESLESLIHYTNLYDDLSDDNSFKAVIYAVNQKGRSQGVVVKDFYFENTSTENRAVLTSTSLDSISPILLGVLFTLLVLCVVIFVRIYYIKTTTTSTITSVSNDLVSNSKQNGTKSESASKKNSKQSPRWQHGGGGGGAGGNNGGGGLGGAGCTSGHQYGGLGADGKGKDGKPDPTEDDRGDPDVIPAQYVSNDGEDSSFNSSKWPNGSYYDPYPNHDIRPTELLIPPSGMGHLGGITAMHGGSATSTPVVNQLHQNINQPTDPTATLKLGAYYSSAAPGTAPNGGPTIALYGSSHHHHHPSSGLMPNGGAPGTAGLIATAAGGPQGVNPNDYDINVHTIKNMLMTTRVPESCV
ncbi:hypothetical protein RP20_CCG008304 [Aedes albopictus]|nr:hypothetical protein RP20_CCG008304 [Aedes albopictus]